MSQEVEMNNLLKILGEEKGFTIIEVMVIVAVLLILVGIFSVGFNSFRRGSDLNKTAEQILSFLRKAQNKTLGSELDSRYGVYFNASSTPQRFVLFKGGSSADGTVKETRSLPEGVSFSEISFQTGDEVVFERLKGETAGWGHLVLRSDSDPSRSTTVYVERSGKTGLMDAAVPSDDSRAKDSRHVHFEYNDNIDTATESIVLEFTYNSSTVTEEIPISDNMSGGQIYWSGEVEAGGSVQRITIQTQRLNNPDTEFCIHRDRRYNDKALSVSLSGDGSGSLIDYSADGMTTSSESIYVTNLIWQ